MNPIRFCFLPILLLTLAACGTRPPLRRAPDGELATSTQLLARLDQDAQDGEAPTPDDDHPEESADESGWEGSFSVLLGGRALDEDRFWDPVDTQFAGGVEFEARPSDLPIGVEAGILWGIGYEDDTPGGFTDDTSATAEFYLGPRLTLELGDSVRPYLGGGATFLGATRENERPLVGGGRQIQEDDDSTIGAYAHAGVQVDVTERFHLGVDVRGVFGTDLTLFGQDTDADYVQVSLLLGTSW